VRSHGRAPHRHLLQPAPLLHGLRWPPRGRGCRAGARAHVSRAHARREQRASRSAAMHCTAAVHTWSVSIIFESRLWCWWRHSSLHEVRHSTVQPSGACERPATSSACGGCASSISQFHPQRQCRSLPRALHWARRGTPGDMRRSMLTRTRPAARGQRLEAADVAGARHGLLALVILVDLHCAARTLSAHRTGPPRAAALRRGTRRGRQTVQCLACCAPPDSTTLCCPYAAVCEALQTTWMFSSSFYTQRLRLSWPLDVSSQCCL